MLVVHHNNCKVMIVGNSSRGGAAERDPRLVHTSRVPVFGYLISTRGALLPTQLIFIKGYMSIVRCRQVSKPMLRHLQLIILHRMYRIFTMKVTQYKIQHFGNTQNKF